MARIIKYLNLVLHGGYWALFTRKIPIFILDFAFLMVLPFSIKITKDLTQNAAEKDILEKEKIRLERDLLKTENDLLQMEISFLKAQINPHFIANSLNTVTALVEDDHPYATDALSILGNILTHTLYTAPNDFIALTEEVTIIRDYTQFQQYRFGDRAKITLNVPPVPDGLVIMPHILFTFVENAYKHGVEKLRKDGYVKLDLEILSDATIVFSVVNNFPPDNAASAMVDGIGWTNVLKRLEVFYKDRYQIDRQITGNEYRVTLKLQLK